MTLEDAMSRWHDERNDGETSETALCTVIDELAAAHPDDAAFGRITRQFFQAAVMTSNSWSDF